VVRNVPDVVVVGGGPAGSALAIALGRAGAKVVLYEKARHPRLKACGEGLLPHGVEALRALVGLPIAPRIRGLRFAAGDVAVDADFPDEFGLVVRRDRFDAWLFELAASTSNVDARPGTRYKHQPARILVGADGARSMFHRRLPGRVARPRRVGLSTHVVGIEGLSDRVEVFFHDEGELYVAPTGGGEALVSALFNHSRFRRDGVPYLLSRTPRLRDRISRLEFTTPTLASAPLGLQVPRIVDVTDPERQLILVGDAAGTPDPITAGGLALTLASTRLAADAIVLGDLQAYERPRLAMGRRAHRLGRWLLWLGQTERRAAWVLANLAPVVPMFLDAAVGSRLKGLDHVEGRS
jgi:flavin-dependent dehydrogenase